MSMKSEFRNDSISILFDTARIQAPANVCWILFGLTSIICNMAVIVTILKTKSLHSKSQFLMVNLCVWELFNGLSFACTGIKRYMIYALSWPEQVSQMVCFAQTLPLIICTCAGIAMTIILSADRFWAMAFPVSYTTHSNSRYIMATNIIVLIYALMSALPGFYGTNATTILTVCTTVAAIPIWYSNLTTVRGAIEISLIFIFYLAALIILRKQIRKTEQLTNQAERVVQRRRLEIGTFRTVIVILIAYLVCIIFSALAYNVTQRIPVETSTKLTPFLALSTMLYSISHFFVYLIMSSKFRTAFLEIFNRNLRTQEMTTTTAVTTIRLNELRMNRVVSVH